jgi:hypothetical protein
MTLKWKQVMDLQIHPPLPQKRDFRIGILGSGFVVNEGHLPAYRKAGFNPAAIASRHRPNAEQTARRHGIPKVHDSYDDLLNDPSIEVLDIAVPPQAQLDLIQRACARKTVKGILAQKPLGVDYAQAVAAALACKQAGIVLSVNQSMRYEPSVRAAKTLLQNGVLGPPVFATIEMRGISRWMPWQAELGWATLRTLSIHHLDCFRYWFGGPAGVYCSIRPDPRTNFPHKDGICSYILDYASGLGCVGIDDPWTGPAKEGCPADTFWRWRIEGLNGLAIGDIGWRGGLCTAPSTIKYASKGDQDFHEPKWTESWHPDAFIGTMAQLLIALETGTEPAISAADNLKTMALVEAAHASTQRFTSINLEDFKVPESLVVQEKQKLGFFHRLFSKATPSAGAPLQREATLQNFTPRAQQSLALARKEADRLNHQFCGTEHLLLGLIMLGQGVAVNVLQKMGLDLETVRKEVEMQVGMGPDQKMIGNIPYTPRVKKVLALASKEAKNLNHTYIGTEHILLGLMREGDGVAARVLKNLHVDVEKTRQEILMELDPQFAGAAPNPVEPASEKTGALNPPVSEDTVSGGLNLKEAEPTPRAQQALKFARQEAERLKHNSIGPEHILIGLIALGNGIAFDALDKLGLHLAAVRGEVEKQAVAAPEEKTTDKMEYDPRSTSILAFAIGEAMALKQNFVGTEHLLLGLLRQEDGLVPQVLKNLGVDPAKIRGEVLKEIERIFGSKSG